MKPKNSLIALVLIFFNSSALYAEDTKVNSGSRSLGNLVLDAQFSGPFKDTIIQRWIDVSAGSICYLYIPVSVPALPQPQTTSSNEQVRVYGPNGIGSISCIPAVIQQKNK